MRKNQDQKSYKRKLKHIRQMKTESCAGFKCWLFQGSSVATFQESELRRSNCDFSNWRSIECAMHSQCTHLNQIKLTSTHTHVCEDCVRTGDRWVHLRLCLTCGHVGCCDSSKNKHATRHFREVAHPLVRSIEPGERWTWCYVDQVEGELAR